MDDLLGNVPTDDERWVEEKHDRGGVDDANRDVRVEAEDDEANVLPAEGQKSQAEPFANQAVLVGAAVQGEGEDAHVEHPGYGEPGVSVEVEAGDRHVELEIYGELGDEPSVKFSTVDGVVNPPRGGLRDGEDGNDAGTEREITTRKRMLSRKMDSMNPQLDTDIGEFHREEPDVMPPPSDSGDWRADHTSVGKDRSFSRDASATERTPRIDINSIFTGGGADGVGSGYVSPSLLTPSEAILRNVQVPIAGRDKESQAVIEALQEVYRTKLKPIEQRSMFDKFHSDVIADTELQAKPQVLVLGAYSTGKTSLIRYFIGQDFPAMDIGPEPSTEVFQAVMAGSDERTINGEAVCIADELPFAGLRKFGAPFLSKFQVSIAPAPLLEHLTFVDTPGILSGETRSSRRGYSFSKVVKWLADRSDLILLMFDSHKLDLGQEFRQVIHAVAHRAEKVRVVLNKAQQVDSDRLIKVYGALMWSIGRCLRDKSDVPKVYVGSFWDGPRRGAEDGDDDGDGDASFDEDEASLRREIMELPKNVGARKINDVMQRAKLVKIHLQIMYAITARMPRLWGSKSAQERIMDCLDEIFEEVKAEGKVLDADMPDIEEYRQMLDEIDFRDLPRRSRRILANLDSIISRDIKNCVAQAGGVRRIYKLDSLAKIGDFLPTPSTGVLSMRRATLGSGSLGRTGSFVSGGGFRRRTGVSRSSVNNLSRKSRRSLPPSGDDLEQWSDDGVSLDEDEDERLGVDAGLLGAGGRRVRRKRGRESDQEVPFMMATVGIVFFIMCLGTFIAYRYPLPNIRELLSSMMPDN